MLLKMVECFIVGLLALCVPIGIAYGVICLWERLNLDTDDVFMVVIGLLCVIIVGSLAFETGCLILNR